MRITFDVVVAMVLEGKSVEHVEGMEELSQSKFAINAVAKEESHVTVVVEMATGNSSI